MDAQLPSSNYTSGFFYLHFFVVFFAAECVYLDRENIFLEPNVVDIVGMVEKDLSEVASVTTVIWF